MVKNVSRVIYGGMRLFGEGEEEEVFRDDVAEVTGEVRLIEELVEFAANDEHFFAWEEAFKFVHPDVSSAWL